MMDLDRENALKRCSTRNSCDGGSPITIAAARKVSGNLKYVGENDELAHRYSHYM